MQEIVKVTSGKDLLKKHKKEKDARQIFGNFIFEGELSILFGDSNAGKSILANDIAFFVSGGGHEWDNIKSPNIPSLYIDMEMTGSQFARRYRDAFDYIPDSYSRAEISTNSTDDKWSFVRTKIITMQSTKNPPKFIVIDNITNGFGSIYAPKQMLELVSELKNLKDRFGLTILLIAHCPKRNKKKPIEQDSLGGSKMILNFVDSAFAVGTSIQGENIRYIKQIKARECEKSGKVLTVKITGKPYLCFEGIEMADEESHLESNKSLFDLQRISPEKEIDLCKMLEEMRLNYRYTYSEIAGSLGLNVYDVIAYKLKYFNDENK